jgi:hypothetical protein
MEMQNTQVGLATRETTDHGFTFVAAIGKDNGTQVIEMTFDGSSIVQISGML